VHRPARCIRFPDRDAVFPKWAAPLSANSHSLSASHSHSSALSYAIFSSMSEPVISVLCAVFLNGRVPFAKILVSVPAVQSQGTLRHHVAGM
jgi:hypothetical protein